MNDRGRKHANAFKLRAEGLSIAEVAERLDVPRSTAGQWLRGVGERCLIRECALCGDRFVTHTAAQGFCTRQHAAKHLRLYGTTAQINGFRRRARVLAAEVAELRERLAA